MVHFWSSGTMPHIYATNSNQWTAPFSQASRPSYQLYSKFKSPISGLTSPTHAGLRRREKWSPYLQDQLIGHALEFWIIWGLKLPGAFQPVLSRTDHSTFFSSVNQFFPRS
jgi:hypothetical protein